MQYPTLTLRGAVEKFVLLFESVNLCSYSKIKPFKTFFFTHELPFLLFIIILLLEVHLKCYQDFDIKKHNFGSCFDAPHRNTPYRRDGL